MLLRHTRSLVTFCLLVGLPVASTNRTADPNEKPLVYEHWTAPQRAAMEQALSGVARSHFAPSLEMKENVDFLLTAALLVQEAVSGGVVMTYPPE